jgi:hypothetical protein
LLVITSRLTSVPARRLKSLCRLARPLSSGRRSALIQTSRSLSRRFVPLALASIEAQAFEALWPIRWFHVQCGKVQLFQIEKKPDRARQSAIQEGISAACKPSDLIKVALAAPKTLSCSAPHRSLSPTIFPVRSLLQDARGLLHSCHRRVHNEVASPLPNRLKADPGKSLDQNLGFNRSQLQRPALLRSCLLCCSLPFPDKAK